MYVIDLNGEEYPAQITYTWEGELNGSQSVSADILPTKVNLRFLHDLTEMWTLVVDDVEYKIKFLKKQGTGNTLKANIKGIPLFFDRFNALRIYERYDRHMTADFYFSLVFDDTEYNYVLNGTFTAQQWEGAGEGATRLEMFKNGLNRYKGEFRIVGNIIYIENMIGVDSQFRYEHRLNASNIVQEIDANDMYTYARGYGDYGDGEGGEDWQDAKLFREYTSPLANIPGISYQHAPPIKNGNITTIETMDEQLKILVDESLQISVTANIYDLREKGYPIAQSNLGDRVFLIDGRIGFDEEIRVVNRMIKKRWDGKVLDASITFGVPGLVKRHQANLRSATKNINDLLDGKIKLPFSVLDNAVANATRALHNMQSELSIPPNGGLLATDKDNPNNVVLFNAAGLGVSDDGGATFDNAITGQGINASVVTTGTMLADRIAGGILASLNGNTVFNLNDGQLDMENTRFNLGGGADIQFLSGGNRLYFQRNDWSAGFGVGTSINDTFPFASLGVSRGNRPHANDLSDFSGFIANANDRENVDDVGNSVVGNRFHVRDRALAYSKGFIFNIDVSDPYFSPMNTGIYSYLLGTPNNRWGDVYAWTYHGNMSGTMSITSTHNSKMAIEDVDAKKAYDYFDMMQVKSYFYKHEDFTDKFKRRVSPVMEQLDPAMENLYKATPDELDFTSNFFLFVQASKHKWEEINERLEVLENGTETA